MIASTADTHSKVLGYVLWLFGFTGSHRFYVCGTIWFLTSGLFLIERLIHLFPESRFSGLLARLDGNG